MSTSFVIISNFRSKDSDTKPDHDDDDKGFTNQEIMLEAAAAAARASLMRRKWSNLGLGDPGKKVAKNTADILQRWQKHDRNSANQANERLINQRSFVGFGKSFPCVSSFDQSTFSNVFHSSTIKTETFMISRNPTTWP